MGKAILGVSVALVATATYASGNKPPDVPTFVAQTVAYAAGVTLNVHGDGSNARGGTPPYFASMPADISTSQTGWYTFAGSDNFKSIPPGAEPKFRTEAECLKVGNFDPIRTYGEPNASHTHEFCGNFMISPYSTFNSLRTNGGTKGSAAQGGPLNKTGYWQPVFVLTNPFGTSKNYGVRSGGMTIYYIGVAGEETEFTRLPRGLRYVGGSHMDDPDDLGAKAEIATANAQSGTAGRYSYIPLRKPIYQCYDGSGSLKGERSYLKNADGTDPWSGTCTGPNGQFIISDEAPGCWDGTNPWSGPTSAGYRHVRYEVFDNVANRRVCPNGWYRFPTLQLKVYYQHQGFTDYSRWRLSSDNAWGIAAGRTALNGESFHFDWFGAWDDTTVTDWMAFCLGLQGLGKGGTPHECGSGATRDGLRLIAAEPAPDGSRNPQAQIRSYSTASTATLYALRSATPTGNKTFTAH